MKLIGNLLAITTNRDSRHQNIELHLDQVEYLTSKKDGRYYQDFQYMDDLDTPLVITGDCLSRSTDKKLDEGEYVFKVWEKEDDTYVLNENKHLSVLLEYDFDEDITLLTSVEYVVTLPHEEFDQLKTQREKMKAFQKGRNKKRR